MSKTDVEKWREAKIQEYEDEKEREELARQRRKEFIKSMKVFEVDVDDVSDVLDSLDFMLSGKDNKYRYNVLRCVTEEFKKRL